MCIKLIYGKKVRFARERIGMNRMDFAVLLGTSEGHLRNIETAKEGKEIRFSREREEIIVKEASLPPGFFVTKDISIETFNDSNDELFYRLFPDAKDKVNYSEALDFISRLAKFKTPK